MFSEARILRAQCLYIIILLLQYTMYICTLMKAPEAGGAAQEADDCLRRVLMECHFSLVFLYIDFFNILF